MANGHGVKRVKFIKDADGEITGCTIEGGPRPTQDGREEAEQANARDLERRMRPFTIFQLQQRKDFLDLSLSHLAEMKHGTGESVSDMSARHTQEHQALREMQSHEMASFLQQER